MSVVQTFYVDVQILRLEDMQDLIHNDIQCALAANNSSNALSLNAYIM